MSIFDYQTVKWANTPDSLFLNLQKDFTNGLVVQLTEKPLEVNKISKKGNPLKIFKYQLKTEDNVDRELSSWSKRLINALVEANIMVGDWFTLTSQGEGYEPDTVTAVKLAFPPTSFAGKSEVSETTETIPF